MTCRLAALSLVGAILVPAAASAQGLPWDGTYRVGPDGDCSRVGEDGGSLRIGGGRLVGAGANCTMTLPVDVLDMDATLYTMECETAPSRDDGGGPGSDLPQSWTARALFMNAAEGDALILVWDGYAFRHERCPAPAAPPDDR